MRKCSNCGRECKDNEYTCMDCGGMTTKAGADNGLKTISSYNPPKRSYNQSKMMSRDEIKLKTFVEIHNLQSLDSEDAKCARDIAKILMGNRLIELGVAFSGNTETSAELSYLSALVEQNWMIINQLDRLNKKLEQVIDEK